MVAANLIIADKIEDSEILRSKWIIDNDIPIFNQDVNYINKFLEAKE